METSDIQSLQGTDLDGISARHQEPEDHGQPGTGNRASEGK
jgi:hypothetical protein